MKKNLTIGVVLLFLLAVGGVLYFSGTRNNSVACTAEAMICPDGSAVGRTGSNCSFAPCPSLTGNLVSDVYPLYPSAQWGIETTTIFEAFAGYGVSSKPVKNISDLSALSLPFEQYYKQKLEEHGWVEDNAYAAGGPGSEITAYRKGNEYVFVSYKTDFHGGGVNTPVTCPCDISLSIFSGSKSSSEYKNTSYTIDGTSVLLTDGVSERPATPGSASTVTTRYFGNEARGDLNNDGKEDIAFLVTQNNGGSGTFYYVVVALKTNTGYQGTNAVLLGDRIAPQTTEIKNGEVIVNYADRKQGEPMTAQPSLGVSKYLKISGINLIEIQ